MKISVITVCYNSAATVHDTLQSVKDQTWPEVEHIVIDGHSADGTVDIVRRFGDSVSIFLSEPDNGIYDAMNKGLRLATGDIIGFLNSDDVYANHLVLARVAQAFIERTLDAMYADVAFFHSETPQKVLRRYRSNRFHPKRISWGWMPAHPTLFMTRKVMERTGLFKTDFRIASDFDYIARAFMGRDLNYWYFPEVLVRMRIGGISTSGWRNTLLLNKEVLFSCRQNGIATNPLKIYSKYLWKVFEFIFKGNR